MILFLYCNHPRSTELDMPQRPEWKYGTSKERLEVSEEKYFEKYLDDIHSKFGSKNLSYFEHNLEVCFQQFSGLG